MNEPSSNRDDRAGEASAGHASTFVTTTTLLDGLVNPRNATAWDGFVHRYKPVLVGYARKFGVPPSEAEDVAQVVLSEFARAYADGSYARGKGRLRAWLFGIARNQVLGWRRERARRERAAAAGRVEAVLAADPAEDELEQAWEREWQSHVMQRCLGMLREMVSPQTLEAFVMFGLQGQPAEAVAERLGMTTNAVFGAKRRVLERLEDVKAAIEREE